MMINLRADNIKLRARAAGMVAEIAAVDTGAAEEALQATNGCLKPAVLVAVGQAPSTAHKILRETGGILSAALARLT